MCVVSLVTGHYQQQFPQVNLFPAELYPGYSELVRKAALYDEMTKQKDCPDPAKVEWQKNLEQYMRDKYGLEPKT